MHGRAATPHTYAEQIEDCIACIDTQLRPMYQSYRRRLCNPRDLTNRLKRHTLFFPLMLSQPLDCFWSLARRTDVSSFEFNYLNVDVRVTPSVWIMNRPRIVATSSKSSSLRKTCERYLFLDITFQQTLSLYFTCISVQVINQWKEERVTDQLYKSCVMMTRLQLLFLDLSNIVRALKEISLLKCKKNIY